MYEDQVYSPAPAYMQKPVSEALNQHMLNNYLFSYVYLKKKKRQQCIQATKHIK